MDDLPFSAECFDAKLLSRRMQRAGLATHQKLGQHFLLDPHVVFDLVAAIEDLTHLHVVEVGSGIGTLTYTLAAVAPRVTAIEIDTRLEHELRHTLKGRRNVEFIFGDALGQPLPSQDEGPWSYVGNIPYNITGALIERALMFEHPPTALVFLVQREVAERLAAPPGDWGVMTIMAQLCAQVDLVGGVVPAASFFPPPRVDSRIVRLIPRLQYDQETRSDLIATARIVFRYRRKMIRHGVSLIVGSAAAADALCEASSIDPTRRAQTLSLEEWRQLSVNVTEWKACNTEG